MAFNMLRTWLRLPGDNAAELDMDGSWCAIERAMRLMLPYHILARTCVAVAVSHAGHNLD